MFHFLKKCFEITQKTLHAFREDDGFNLAAALSFYTILSLVPLSMIVVSILGHYFGNSDEAYQRSLQLLTDAIPSLSPKFMAQWKTLIYRKVATGWIGGVSLFLIATVLLTNLEKILNKIFGADRSRHFLHSRLLSVGLIFLFALLTFVPGVIHALEGIFHFFHLPLSLDFLTTGHVFSFLVSWISFVLVMAFVPNHRVEFKPNVAGGFVFALLLMLAKIIFREYTAFSFQQMNVLYGSFSALVLVILWIFYLNNLVILCAELVGVLQESKIRRL